MYEYLLHPETGSVTQRSLYRDMDFDTDISVCKTRVVDEKFWF